MPAFGLTVEGDTFARVMQAGSPTDCVTISPSIRIIVLRPVASVFTIYCTVPPLCYTNRGHSPNDVFYWLTDWLCASHSSLPSPLPLPPSFLHKDAGTPEEFSVRWSAAIGLTDSQGVVDRQGDLTINQGDSIVWKWDERETALPCLLLLPQRAFLASSN